MTEPPIPNHVGHFPGLFEWQAGVVVDAPSEDVEVARSYPLFSDKGLLTSGMRLTLMSRRLDYRVGQDVRIIHVVEAVEPSRQLYVLGPKPVYGEYVDDLLVTAPPPPDLWEPATYNGPVLTSPAADYNYEITSYRFDTVGAHRIQWRLGDLYSNVLNVEIAP